MDRTPRLIPVWLWVSAIIIIVLLCSSCRGGRSLGKGSAGTVIVPQTPQEINERNRQPPPKMVLPPLEPLAPIPVIPPKTTPVAPRVPSKAVRSTPTLPESNSVEANPVIINPKPAGEMKSFSPTINRNATPVMLTAPKPIEVNNKYAVNVSPLKNSPSDDKATSTQTKIGGEEDKVTFNWGELITWWMFLFLAIIFGWIIFDIIKDCIKGFKNKETQITPTKKKSTRKPTKKATKKAAKKTAKKKPINKNK